MTDFDVMGRFMMGITGRGTTNKFKDSSAYFKDNSADSGIIRNSAFDRNPKTLYEYRMGGPNGDI